MDLTSAIVGAIFILACSLPFILMYNKRKKKEKALLQGMKSKISSQGGEYAQHEFCGDLIFGLNDRETFFYYGKVTRRGLEDALVELAQFSSCKIVKEQAASVSSGSSLSTLEKLELVFVPKQKNQPEMKLLLFDAEDAVQHSGELLFAVKWEKQLNRLLRSA